MMRFGTLRSLSAGDWALFVGALALLIRVRLALPFLSLDRLRAWACRPGYGSRRVTRIAWAVEAAARRLPGTTCLPMALVAQRLLSSSGHRGELHVGVTRAGAKFAAHAWVECEGRVLIGEEESRAYTRLLAWPAEPPA